MVDLSPASRPPEAHPNFRRGQLLVLLATFDEALTIDRIGYLEFFAANPHLAIRDELGSVRLQLAGFSPAALSYQSAPERFANRRSRLRTDLSALTAWGYAEVRIDDGRIVVGLTARGRANASELSTLYADAYRQSIELIRPLFRQSDAALAAKASDWLAGSDQRVDILDVNLEAQVRFEFDSVDGDAR
jgi:hypothetical protein